MATWIEHHVGIDADELRDVAREGLMGFRTVINDWKMPTYL
ncbi:MAG: hypothetical protein RI568_11905 [Natronomonas sp.]|nr:hypothetical protein [Natronomonas sp.]MDR9431385.1 hypothetical protein [Natronomonas sp.]